jgi:hypothetical protein
MSAILAKSGEDFNGTGVKLDMLKLSIQSLSQDFAKFIEDWQKGGAAQVLVTGEVERAVVSMAESGSVNMLDFARAAVVAGLKVAKAYAIQGIFAAVSKALQSLPFPVNLVAAAGAAGVAGALLNGLTNRIAAPKLAKGGLAYGETLAMVGDNPAANVDPEVIAPLSKLKNILGGSQMNVGGTFRIRGEDLELVLQKAQTTKQRRYGR